jgi:hypothetical protein
MTPARRSHPNHTPVDPQPDPGATTATARPGHEQAASDHGIEPVLLIGGRAVSTPTRSTDREARERGLSPAAFTAWRRQAWSLANRIAFRQGFPRLVRRCRIGHGFLVIDLPPPPRVPPSDPCVIRIALWWQLASGSGIFTTPREAVAPLLPDPSPLGRMLRDHERPFAALRAALAPPEPETALALLGGHASPEDWRDVLRLLAVCRRLQHGAQAGGFDLWRHNERQGR